VWRRAVSVLLIEKLFGNPMWKCGVGTMGGVLASAMIRNSAVEIPPDTNRFSGPASQEPLTSGNGTDAWTYNFSELSGLAGDYFIATEEFERQQLIVALEGVQSGTLSVSNFWNDSVWSSSKDSNFSRAVPIKKTATGGKF